MINLTSKIKHEISYALELLGADRELLATVRSWGDTLPDEEVLRMLRDWNCSKVFATLQKY